MFELANANKINFFSSLARNFAIFSKKVDVSDSIPRNENFQAVFQLMVSKTKSRNVIKTSWNCKTDVKILKSNDSLWRKFLNYLFYLFSLAFHPSEIDNMGKRILGDMVVKSNPCLVWLCSLDAI